jgi:hypothetical protein
MLVMLRFISVGGYTLSLSTSISNVCFSSIFAPTKILKHMRKCNHGWRLNMSVLVAVDQQTRVKYTNNYPYVYLMVLSRNSSLWANLPVNSYIFFT